jgi:hypothetical protein
VQPWGWNWVDNDRWGFAPFHYGRWAQIGGRWGWIPGGGAAVAEGGYPVYSPALVSFIGVAGAGLGFSIGVGGFAPAWVPLGWHEPYYPWYHCRQDYFARVNSYYGVPRTIIERGPTYINNVNVRQTNIFINRGAATVVPAADFARGGSIMRFGHPVPERAFADARPLGGRLPVTPTAFTPNLPLEAAHRFNIAQPLHPGRGPPYSRRCTRRARGSRIATRRIAPKHSCRAGGPDSGAYRRDRAAASRRARHAA